METFSTLLALFEWIHWSSMDSPHKSQWCSALMFSLICVWTNGRANNRNTGDLRHQWLGAVEWKYMMTSSNGNIYTVLALSAGNSPVNGEFPAQRPVTWSFDVFFDICPNKQLSKQSWGWWFEMPSHSLWLHCNDKWITESKMALLADDHINHSASMS